MSDIVDKREHTENEPITCWNSLGLVITSIIKFSHALSCFNERMALHMYHGVIQHNVINTTT